MCEGGGEDMQRQRNARGLREYCMQAHGCSCVVIALCKSAFMRMCVRARAASARAVLRLFVWVKGYV
eukprot:6191107-Pleurochrysis_carterae.AAC.4